MLPLPSMYSFYPNAKVHVPGSKVVTTEKYRITQSLFICFRFDPTIPGVWDLEQANGAGVITAIHEQKMLAVVWGEIILAPQHVMHISGTVNLTSTRCITNLTYLFTIRRRGCCSVSSQNGCPCGPFSRFLVIAQWKQQFEPKIQAEQYTSPKIQLDFKILDKEKLHTV